MSTLETELRAAKPKITLLDETERFLVFEKIGQGQFVLRAAQSSAELAGAYMHGGNRVMIQRRSK